MYCLVLPFLLGTLTSFCIYQLLNNVDMILSDPIGEFAKRVDFCQSASWNFSSTSVEFFNDEVTVPMGPIIVEFCKSVYIPCSMHVPEFLS